MTEEQKLENNIQAQPDFEDWLEEHFIATNEVGGIAITKDNVEDLFERFLESQEIDDMIKLANLFGNEKYLHGHQDCIKQLKTNISDIELSQPH